MRSLVVAHATTRAPDVDPAALGYDRHRSDHGTAVELLTWLAANPESGDRLRSVLRTDQLAGRPEAAPVDMHTRADTLLAAGWDPADHEHSLIGARLDEHATAAGWGGVAEWLDQLATSHDTTKFQPVVVDLDTLRARHARHSGQPRTTRSRRP